MKKYKNILSVALVLSMLMAGSGCSNKESEKKESSHEKGIIPNYCKIISSDVATKIAETSKSAILSKVDESASSMVQNIDGCDEMHKVILDSISYSIHGTSFSYDGEYSSVKATFHMLDYEKVVNSGKKYRDEESFIEDLKNAGTKDYRVTYQIEWTDDGPVIVNEEEVSETVLAFLDEYFVIEGQKAPDDMLNSQYTAVVDYKKYFDLTVEYVLGENLDMEGELNIYLYLYIDDEVATIKLDKDRLMDDIYNYVVLNADAMVKASTGFPMSAVKVVSGMTDEDIYDMIMEGVEDEVDAIDFDLFNMNGPYEIEDNIIYIHGEEYGELVGTIEGNKITLDISDNEDIDDYLDEDILVFKKDT